MPGGLLDAQSFWKIAVIVLLGYAYGKLGMAPPRLPPSLRSKQTCTPTNTTNQLAFSWCLSQPVPYIYTTGASVYSVCV